MLDHHCRNTLSLFLREGCSGLKADERAAPGRPSFLSSLGIIGDGLDHLQSVL